jgi:hypothetical protein
MVPVLKTGDVNASVGSNPTFSAKKNTPHMGCILFIPSNVDSNPSLPPPVADKGKRGGVIVEQSGTEFKKNLSPYNSIIIRNIDLLCWY